MARKATPEYHIKFPGKRYPVYRCTGSDFTNPKTPLTVDYLNVPEDIGKRVCQSAFNALVVMFGPLNEENRLRVSSYLEGVNHIALIRAHGDVKSGVHRIYERTDDDGEGRISSEVIGEMVAHCPSIALAILVSCNDRVTQVSSPVVPVVYANGEVVMRDWMSTLIFKSQRNSF